MPRPTGIAQLPGFVESLRLLFEREQYALRDVAAMFGVSAERIRQLCVVHGVTHFTTAQKYLSGQKAVRVWCDHTHRFLPVPKGAYLLGTELQRKAARRARLEARRAARRAHAVACYHACVARWQRKPTLAEWASEVYGRPMSPQEAGGRLVGWWGRGAKLADLYAAVGSTPRGCGEHGHVFPKRRRRRNLSPGGASGAV